MRTESIGQVSSPGAAAAGGKPRRLCIVSREPLKCGEFVDGLQMVIGSDEDIKIIVDRRQTVTACERERRRQPHLDFLLQMNGFFIVPTERSEAPPERTEVATKRTEVAIERTEVATEHTEEPRRRAGEVDEEDRRRLESILDFESQREESRRPKWILVGLVGLGALVVAALAFLPTFLSRFRLAPPIVGQVQTPPAVETTAPAGQVTTPPSREVAPAPRPEVNPLASVSPEPPARADTPARTEIPPVETPSAPVRGDAPSLPRVEPPAATVPQPPREVVAPPRPAPAPIPSVPATVAARREPALPGFAGLPRVELVRRPAAGPGRGGEAYAVRVLDAAGRPIAGAEVSLLASTAGDTVLDIPLDSGPEPGIYEGTVPPGRPALTNLRVRVVTSNKRVEIPVTR
jgi:hypothetical protein